MTELYAVILITLLAVISPGADFAIVTKNSYLYGKKTGLLTAVGISLGVLTHVTYTLFAIGFVMAYTPYILNFIKYIGAFYLVYIGYKTFTQAIILDQNSSQTLTPFSALKYGFFTNALNPKTTLFVISTYTQIVSPQTNEFLLIGYGLFMSFAHFIWFGILAIVFSTQNLRQKMIQKQKVINKIIGSILTVLGISLLFVSFK
ncbi:LysE family translocator [Acinetobacter sp. HY1485]|uniref:LysE family translocator n=1 Tax=Acinetobacter sp. HY1485 TaxID=2970918 RepID=UPI0022B94DFD|nr:LysE family translocator [Acinetobacter sp. HY1485]